MQARVTTTQYKPGEEEEGIEIYSQSLVSEARKQPGFKGAMLLVDRSSKKCISITLWDQHQHERETGVGTQHLRSVTSKVSDRITTAPSIETFEVAFQSDFSK